MPHSLRDIPRLAATADGRWEIGRGVAYRLWPLLRPMAARWRQSALGRTSLAAVVGSLGKTTTVRCVAAAVGEPEPLLPFNQFGLLALNLLAIKPGRKRAVLEVGIDKPGEMAVYAQLCRPDAVVVTSIASDHVKHMNSLDTTAREKAAMLAGLRPGGVAVLNGDDGRVLAMKALAPRVITYGFGEHQVRCVRAELSWPEGTRLALDVDGQRLDLTSRLVGRIMVYPVLAALAVAKAMGVDVRAAAERLEKLAPTPGRLAPLLLDTGAALLCDEHKASAESFVSAFDALAVIPAQRRLALLGDIFEPWGDVDARYRELALRLAKHCDGTVLVGEHAHRWLPGLIAGGLPRDKIVSNLSTLDDAAAYWQRELRSGDVLLIKGRQEEHLERVALALAGRKVDCSLPTCEAINLACDRCGGRGRSQRHAPRPSSQQDITPSVLDAVEHSLWRRYNDHVVGSFLSQRLAPTESVVLKTDAFEEAMGNRHYRQALSGGMVGMDISQTVLDHAQKRVPQLPLVRADVRRLPFSDGALAGVVSTSTLDHFSDAWDLEHSLREIARVLQPGGQLLLTLDNPWHPLLAFRNLVPHRLRLLLKMTPYYVGYTYTPRQVERVFDSLGFQVREVGAVLHFPRTLVGLWGGLSRKAGLGGFDERLLGQLCKAERLARWRTRWLTGQYIAVDARRC